MLDTAITANLYAYLRQLPHYDPEYALTVVSTDGTEPVTYSDLTAHLRLDETDDESLVTGLATVARVYVETATKLSLIARTYDVTFDSFAWCDGLRLPRRPVSAVTSVTYVDPAGTTQTLSPSLYDVDSKAIRTTIRPKIGTTYPSTIIRPNAVTVRFSTTGATGDQLALACHAIKLMAANLYESREVLAAGKLNDVLPHGFEAILWQLAAPEV